MSSKGTASRTSCLLVFPMIKCSEYHNVVKLLKRGMKKGISLLWKSRYGINTHWWSPCQFQATTIKGLRNVPDNKCLLSRLIIVTMSEWNSMKALDKYVHDYMLKRKMTMTADIFAKEANIAPTDVAIDHPDGFLSEWWSIFWDIFKSRLQNHQGHEQEVAEAAGNAAQRASPIPPVPDPLVFGNMLQSLFSTMPMPEMNQQFLSLIQPATANLAMNQDTFSVMPPSIPKPPMNERTLTLLQPTFPNLAMNQQAMVLMQPCSSILNPAMNQQPVMGMMQPSSSIENPAMNQQAMGMVHPPSSVPLSKPAMVVRIPPTSISMNQQAMGVMQPPSPIPILDQQAMGSMRAPSSIPMNQQAMGVMQPPSSMISSIIHQQMLAQLPEELRGEPVSILLEKMYEQECLRRSARDLATKVQQLDAVKMNPMLASSSNPVLAPSSRSIYLPQQNAENIQQWFGREDKCPMNYERSNVVVPTSQESSKAEIPDAGNNKGIQQIPVTRHCLTGIGLFSPGLRNQVSHSFVSLPNQQQQHFPPSGGHYTTGVGLVSPGLGNQVTCSLGSLPNHQQLFTSSGGNSEVDTLLAVAVQTSENLKSSISQSSHNLMAIDDLSGKDLQMSHDAHTISGEEAEKQASAGEAVPMNQQNNVNGRNWAKESSSSVALDSALDGKEAEKEKSMDEDIEAYFSNENDENDDVANTSSTIQQNSSTHFTSEPEGFSFKEVRSLHSANNKLLSCHFSSSGKLLAAVGHERKVLLWDMENYSVNTVSGHSDIITDVRFRPNSTVFGTSSFDKTVLIWDASKGSKPRAYLTGHSEHVTSLDFHPRKVDLICSCDSGKEIRFWNVNYYSSCSHISKGAGTQARFQPRFGEILAAVMGNSVSLLDVETKRIVCQLEGHSKDIRSFCWDSTGKYIAAVSEDSARIWSINSGGHCLHAFQHKGNTFESCTFHPGYSQLLIIGSNQSIHLWNPTENNRTWSYRAHESQIAALAESPFTETIASASHDQWLKLWK